MILPLMNAKLDQVMELLYWFLTSSEHGCRRVPIARPSMVRPDRRHGSLHCSCLLITTTRDGFSPLIAIPVILGTTQESGEREQ